MFTIKTRSVTATLIVLLLNLTLWIWAVYLTIRVAQHVNAWPF